MPLNDVPAKHDYVGFAYVVRISFAAERESAFEAFVDWLLKKQVAVCTAGGCHGEILLVEPGLAVEARYRFPSREAYEAYERDHAPGLRGEALAVLAAHDCGPNVGTVFERSWARVVHLHP